MWCRAKCGQGGGVGGGEKMGGKESDNDRDKRCSMNSVHSQLWRIESDCSYVQATAPPLYSYFVFVSCQSDQLGMDLSSEGAPREFQLGGKRESPNYSSSSSKIDSNDEVLPWLLLLLLDPHPGEITDDESVF